MPISARRSASGAAPHGTTCCQRCLGQTHGGAANRDPERYTDPDRLDLRLPEPRPLSFGTGVHARLGAWVARLEGEVALPMLLDGLPTIGRIAGPLQWWSEPAAIRALRALPVELSTR